MRRPTPSLLAVSGFVSVLAFASMAVALLVPACRELPPEIPAGYLGSEPDAPAWPPPEAFDAEPLHPANRWFQRAFAPRGPAGEILPVSPDEPLPLATDLGAVDRAEILALTAEAAGDWLLTEGPPLREALRAIFSADILQTALAYPGAEARAFEQDLLRAARVPAGVDSETHLPPLALPPPLREAPGEWLEDSPPTAPGLVPCVHDLRWARRARHEAAGDEEYRSILLRLRVALDERGEPLLLPLASEAWELRAGAGGDAPLEARVWRFDRAAWRRGDDPWTAHEGDSPIEVRDPESVFGRRVRGTVESVCAGCHEERDDLRPLLRRDRVPLGPFRPVADPDRREAERLRVRQVLQALAP